MGKRAYLVDGSGYIFRAYYAVAPLRTKDGFPTNALFGYLRMLLKLLTAADSEHVVVVFDSGKETFRTEMYSEYKANRKECPEELLKQMPYFRDFSEALGLLILEKKGFEADDILGTLTKKLKKENIEVVIVSGDKDLMQLVEPGVTIWDTMRDIHYDSAGVKDKMGVSPEKIVELLAVMGDSSDNVPGLRGAGPKTAVQLIERYGEVENIIKSFVEIAQDSAIRNRAKLSKQIELDAEILRLSRKLVEIDTDVPLSFNISQKMKEIQSMNADELHSVMLRKEPFTEKLESLVSKFEFSSLVKDFRLNLPSSSESQKTYNYKIIYRADFEAWFDEFRKQEIFSFDLETTSLDILDAKIIGASFCWSDDEAFYIPIAHTVSPKEQVKLNDFIEAISIVLSKPDIQKVGQNLKYDIGVLANYDVTVRGIKFDTMIAAYLLNPDRRSYNLSALAEDVLQRKLIEYDELLQSNLFYADVDVESAAQYAGQDAHVAWLVMQKLKERINKENLNKVFEEIEMPLVPILQEMERNGVKLDTDLLYSLSTVFETELVELQKQLYALAGSEFNLNSPKQLSDVLFNKLGISTKGLKKTKTGISTDSSVLEKLLGTHPLPALLLRYRMLSKLKNTYVDVLPAMISKKTGRLHAKFNQAITATGRLSSSDPNLQNIPIQTEEGRRIREAFIADEGNLILSADYSQIELRILAHMSEDETLIEAFKNDIDIHAKTAREIMNLSEKEEITSALRRIGKTINFGVIYGMSGFRLGKQLEIPVSVANQYIENYFNKYPSVKEFFARLTNEALEQGFVTTIFGRKRIITDIDTSERDKGFAIRAAINAPMQGTAADLIKMAMIRIDKRIKELNMPIKMIMQIHDELVFECAASYSVQARDEIIKAMENVISLKVPLRVDCAFGKNWQEAHG
jgi:DNA polymerase-1